MQNLRSIILCLVLLSLSSFSFGADIFVTTTDIEWPTADNDNCTIFEAVRAAHDNVAVDGCTAGVGEDTIILPAAAEWVFTDVQGSIFSSVQEALTIQGVVETDPDSGEELARTSFVHQAANGKKARFFSVSAGGELTLRNLRLTGGNSNHGGAIIVSNGTITLDNTHVSENSGSYGGALRVDGGSVTITGKSQLHNNSAAQKGGALFAIQPSLLLIDDASFVDNSAAVIGGAVFVERPEELTITAAHFTGNTGTAVYAIEPEIGLIKDSFFTGNSGSTGGALTLSVSLGAADASPINIETTKFQDNTAVAFGGALAAFVPVKVEDCILQGNSAGSSGGAIYSRDSNLQLVQSTLIDNFVDKENVAEAAHGGGVYMRGPGLRVLRDVQIRGSHRTTEGQFHGAALYAFSDPIVHVLNSAMYQNVGDSLLYNNLASYHFVNTTIANNTVAQSGVLASNGSVATSKFDHVTIVGNSSGTGVIRTANAEVRSSVILDNTDADCRMHDKYTSLGHNTIGRGLGCGVTLAETDVMQDGNLGAIELADYVTSTELNGQPLFTPVVSSEAFNLVDSADASACTTLEVCVDGQVVEIDDVDILQCAEQFAILAHDQLGNPRDSSCDRGAIEFYPDNDGDGHNALVDCFDNDPLSHPGADELCDGLDNDCDEDVDEGFGLGAACSAGIGECVDSGVMACSADKLTVECDAVALDPLTEICGDSLDNNCNGEVDEVDLCPLAPEPEPEPIAPDPAPEPEPDAESETQEAEPEAPAEKLEPELDPLAENESAESAECVDASTTDKLLYKLSFGLAGSTKTECPEVGEPAAPTESAASSGGGCTLRP